MKINLLTEITRMREVMGLNIIIESVDGSPLLKGFRAIFEMFFDKEGIQFAKLSDEELEKISKKYEDPAYKMFYNPELEKIRKIGEGANRETSLKYFEELLENQGFRDMLFLDLKIRAPKTFARISNEILRRSLSEVRYNELYSMIKGVTDEGMRKYVIKRIIKSFEEVGLVTEKNKFFIENWTPIESEVEKSKPLASKVEKPTSAQPKIDIKSTSSLSPEEVIQKPNLVISGSGAKGERAMDFQYNENSSSIADREVIKDRRDGFFPQRQNVYRYEPNLDVMGNQQVHFSVSTLDGGNPIFVDHTGSRPNRIILTLIIPKGEKISQQTLEKIQNKLYEEVKNNVRYLQQGPIIDLTQLPKQTWKKIMNNMENFISGK